MKQEREREDLARKTWEFQLAKIETKIETMKDQVSVPFSDPGVGDSAADEKRHSK